MGIGVGASEILPQMEQMPEMQLVAAADLNPRVLSTFQHRYGAKTYNSIEKLCADPNVDAVIIATPNFTHRPITLAAAKHGKHVMCEKPLGLNAGEVRQMYDAGECGSGRSQTAASIRSQE